MAFGLPFAWQVPKMPIKIKAKLKQWGKTLENKQNIIEVNNISFSYAQGKKQAVKNLSMTVKNGEFIAVLGANGCGKSTLAKHFNAILLPQKGNVSVMDISTFDENRLIELRQKVGMVFQNPDNQIVATIVEEDVAFAPENLGVVQSELRQRVDQAMQMAGIMKHKNKAPHKLSGGQKQRVAIAGVIAMRPNCLVLDEATAMLDPIGREKVMSTVKKLNKDFNITVVHITHYMEEAVLADKIIVMHEGEIAMQGTPKEVFSQIEKVRSYKIDVPQAAELCFLLSAQGINMKKDIITYEECAQELFKLFESAGAQK